jgi:tRNA threonylcarbamoyladenosine biosynthesis protein TsaB
VSDRSLILSFDTSAAHCAVALVEDGEPLVSRTEPMATGQAERLFALLECALADAGRSWAQLSAIAVATGPGNFTGVRIAVSAARGLALSLGIPAIGVTVLQALARPIRGPSLITLDARRDHLFAQFFLDGAPQGEAELVNWQDLTGRQPNSGLVCTGYRSTEIARAFGASAGSERLTADPVQIALHAMDHPGTRRPAPVYLRPPDAALPSDPPPVILHDA